VPFFNQFNIDRTMFKQNFDYLAQPFRYKKIRAEIEDKVSTEQPTDTILALVKTQMGVPSQEREEKILRAIQNTSGTTSDTTLEDILSPSNPIMKE